MCEKEIECVSSEYETHYIYSLMYCKGVKDQKDNVIKSIKITESFFSIMLTNL